MPLPVDVLPPSPPPTTETGGSSSGDGLSTSGIFAVSVGILVLLVVIVLYVVSQRRKPCGGRIGGPQWHQ
jgi:hypothetical protein